MPEQIVLATNNSGKLKEFKTLFSPYGIQIINQGQFNIESAIEDGLSFVENAIIKARHACLHSKLPAIADDSGLEVAALNGKPGIYSARFAGNNASDEQNYQTLLEAMQHLNESQREARFRCLMVYMRHAEDPTPIIAQGELNGVILNQPRGANGFGYDPIFLLPGKNQTCAEIELELKNRISHRAQACRELIEKLIANQLINT